MPLMGAPNLHCPNSSNVLFSLGEMRGPLPRGDDDVLQRLQRTTPTVHGCSSWPRLMLRATPPRSVSQSVSCHRSSAVSSEPLASGQKPRTLGGFQRLAQAWHASSRALWCVKARTICSPPPASRQGSAMSGTLRASGSSSVYTEPTNGEHRAVFALGGAGQGNLFVPYSHM